MLPSAISLLSLLTVRAQDNPPYEDGLTTAYATFAIVSSDPNTLDYNPTQASGLIQEFRNWATSYVAPDFLHNSQLLNLQSSRLDLTSPDSKSDQLSHAMEMTPYPFSRNFPAPYSGVGFSICTQRSKGSCTCNRNDGLYGKCSGDISLSCLNWCESVLFHSCRYERRAQGPLSFHVTNPDDPSESLYCYMRFVFVLPQISRHNFEKIGVGLSDPQVQISLVQAAQQHSNLVIERFILGTLTAEISYADEPNAYQLTSQLAFSGNAKNDEDIDGSGKDIMAGVLLDQALPAIGIREVTVTSIDFSSIVCNGDCTIVNYLVTLEQGSSPEDVQSALESVGQDVAFRSSQGGVVMTLAKALEEGGAIDDDDDIKYFPLSGLQSLLVRQLITEDVSVEPSEKPGPEEGGTSPADSGSSSTPSLEWWMVVIIVVGSLGVCCGFGVGAFFCYRAKKSADGERDAHLKHWDFESSIGVGMEGGRGLRPSKYDASSSVVSEDFRNILRTIEEIRADQDAVRRFSRMHHLPPIAEDQPLEQGSRMGSVDVDEEGFLGREVCVLNDDFSRSMTETMSATSELPPMGTEGKMSTFYRPPMGEGGVAPRPRDDDASSMGMSSAFHAHL